MHDASVETTTVLFTDMVGSTALRARLGDRVADAVLLEHDTLLDTVVQARGGRVVKHLGDGVLAAFRSAGDAVEAAALVQRRVVQRRRQDPVRGFALRVGLAAGDVHVDDGDLSGTPVVEASRLCDLAGGDQVLISEVVRVLVGSRTDCPVRPWATGALRGLPASPGVLELDWSAMPSPDGQDVPLPAVLVRARDHAYVGRRPVVDQLCALLDGALAGASGTALLSGEPGIGKTRTAAEVAAAAAETGAVVLYGRCDEVLGAPYQPFVEALERYVRDAADPRLGRLARELSRLVPELPELVPGLGRPVSSDARTEEFRLHEAVASWVTEASRACGLLLVLDDLHWADAATLSLLRHLLRGLAHADARVLVLATYRDTEAQPDPRLLALVAELHRLPSSLRFVLDGLDEQEVVDLVATRAGHPLDDDQRALALRVRAECDGNPFFVRELIRHWVDTGLMRQVAGRWRLTGDVEVPDSVRDVVARRLESLSPAAADLLRTAAVLGRDVELALLAPLHDTVPGEALPLLEEAVGARLLEERGPGRYRFSHALVRTTLYDGLSATRRALMHRRVVAQLRDGGDVVALAHHGLLSRPVGAEAVEVAGWAVASGEQALAARALADAEQRIRGALDVLEGTGADGPLLARALCGLGEAQRDQGDPRFRETLARAGAVADACGEVDLVVRAALADDRGMTLVAAPDPERVARVERALHLVGPAVSEARALLLTRLLGEVTFGGDPARRRRLALEVEAMAQHLADPAATARVLVRTGMAAHMLTGGAGALERAQRNARLADGVGDPALRVTALSWLSAAQVVAGRVGEAAETSALMVDVAEEASPAMRWFARLLQIKFLSLRGDFAGASAENDACLRLALDLAEPDAEALWGAVTAVVALNAGAAAGFADAAGAFAERFPTVPSWQAGHASFLAEAGRGEEARAVLSRARLDPGVLMEEPFAFQGPFSLATAAVGAADPDLARRVQRVLAPHRGRWSHIYLGVLGPVRWALGRCAVATGALDVAVADLAGALEEARSAGSDPLSGLIALDLAGAFAQRAGSADRSAALELLDEVEDREARHLGDRVELIREVLAS